MLEDIKKSNVFESIKFINLIMGRKIDAVSNTF